MFGRGKKNEIARANAPRIDSKTPDPLRRLGVLDDEDVCAMQQGATLVKVRSQRWQKRRSIRLLDDGATIWCQSNKRSRKARQMQSFSVWDVECIREGCQSDCLRRLGASVSESLCFTLVFRGGLRKSLDLRCSSAKEAQHWVRGIRTLQDRLSNMTQKDKLDHWIRGYLRRADLNQDGAMSYDEIQHLLQMLNIDLNETYARSLFKKCDRTCNGRLDPRETEEFCRELLRRPELDAVFRRYSGNGCVLTTAELRDFLGDQGEDASLEHAHTLIHTYEFNDWAHEHLFMTENGFTLYMLTKENDIFNQHHTTVYQDMTRPLSHYYISSSHNTYLTKDQLTSQSSTDSYIRALNQGCRCVELDCWDGDKGEPMIYHGHTLTSKVPFKDVIMTIAQYAFKKSPYPVILSLEVHCSLEQQAVMARHLRSILGKRLLTRPLNTQPLTRLPSPEELRGRVLVKAKRIGALGKTESSSSFGIGALGKMDRSGSIDSSFDEDPSSGPKRPKGCSKVSAELSDLVVYCCSVSFRNFEEANQQSPDLMSSFNENDALKHIKDSGRQFVRLNSRCLSRVYPSGQRLDSSNYQPQDMWNAGCQLVALNFQTAGEQMDLNQGRFLDNGCCGYTLKPNFLCQDHAQFNPENTGGGPGNSPTQLTIRVISAQQLPKVCAERLNAIVDPQVTVETYGVAIDCNRQKTHRVDNNGFNPRWDVTLAFQLQVPELVLVRFVVEDHDHTAKNDFVGQFTLPFSSLKPGYRHVHLLRADGSSLSPASLFVHIKMTPLSLPVRSVAQRMAKT